jgi:hypothetical protein
MSTIDTAPPNAAALQIPLARHASIDGMEADRALVAEAGQDHEAFWASLAPQKRIRERRNVAHVNPAADHHAPLRDRLQCLRNERTDRCEKQRRIELVGRRLVTAARLSRAETQCELLGCVIAGARERIRALLMTRNLRDDIAPRRQNRRCRSAARCPPCSGCDSR